jgi:hypothetical protein
VIVISLAPRFIRVLVSGVIAWSVLQLGKLGLHLSPELVATFQTELLVFLTAIVNGLVGLLAKRYPSAEWILFGPAPDYHLRDK